ncbi:MAG TPA: CoA transferase [Sphingobium sp.]
MRHDHPMPGEILAALGLDHGVAARFGVAGGERLPSCFAVTDLATASIGAAGLAAAELLALGGIAAPGVMVDRHLANSWFRWSLKPVGWEMPAPWDPMAGDYRAADGWIRLHTNAPMHRDAALAVLGCAGEREAVAARVAGYGADALEQAIVAAGGCAAAMRSVAAWEAHPQGRAAMAEPLVALTQSRASGPSRWTPTAQRPLAGIRVLDLTRVLAGPVATRFLAGLGADVLRIDPPGWEEPGVIPDVTLGKRCARLDLHAPADRERFEALLVQADILVHGYRPGALEGLGYGPAARRAINAAMVEVSLCAYGWSGPWAARRGFDSLVQMSCGIAAAGMAWKGADRPVPLPVQALDHATGYLMAAAALSGLIARHRDGVAQTARLSLARTAELLVARVAQPSEVDSAPVGQVDFAAAIEPTPWGDARRLRSPVTIGGIPLSWSRPAAMLGSSAAAWED